MSRRTVLVTGGNRGIGLACARAFAEQGDRVAVTCRGDAPAEVLEAGLLPVACDITDADQVEAAFARVEEELGAVEVLVSNAGITRDSLVLRMSDDDFTDVLEANLTGGFRVARRAVKGMMRARWGRIVFVSSIAGRIGQAGQANYAASKAGVIGFTKSVARELAPRGVRCNAIAPGFIRTDMTDALTEQQIEVLQNQIPLARLGETNDISGVALFLVSPAACYITGQVLAVDGGMVM